MGRIWAIGDLHLSFALPDKSMDLFGDDWKNHAEKIALHWKSVVHPEDLVLIPGDISWAMRLEEALIDLQWIDQLPGTKVMIKGNHDYWWDSLKKLVQVMPPSIHVIQNNSFSWKEVAIGGTRLWDSSEYDFSSFIEYRENPKQKGMDVEEKMQEELRGKIFTRELSRLEMSLKELNPKAKTRIAMTHYPPIGADLASSQAHQLFLKYGVTIVVFGHLHSLKKGVSLFGEKEGIRYICVSADLIHFQMTAIL